MRKPSASTISIVSTAIVLFAVFMVSVSNIAPSEPRPFDGHPVEDGAPALAFDEQDLRAVAGYFDDIFVGRVVGRADTIRVGVGVFTNYRVKVIDLLKGELADEIVVTQQGGLYDGKWVHILSDADFKDDSLLGAGDSENLLEVGAVYRLTTIRNNVIGTNLIGPSSQSVVRLEVKGTTDADIARGVNNLPEIVEMRAAVADQIPR